MINDKKTKFTYSKESHTTLCKRVVKNKVYTGIARCHPNDYEFESKLVGEHFAYTRAMIAQLRHDRDDLKCQLKTLRHLYNILEQNPRAHYDSTECYTIRKQMKLIERDIAEIRITIKESQEELRTLSMQKDSLYQHIKANRSKHIVEVPGVIAPIVQSERV